MLRYSQLYTLHYVIVLDFHPWTPGSRPRPWSGTVNCTHYMMLLYLIFIPSILDQRPRPWSVTVNCTHYIMLLYLISSLHSWIKTQTMVRYSQLYTLHHVTEHPFTHGSRPRPWSGIVDCTHYIMLLFLIFIPSLMDQDPDHDKVQSTVHTTSC
jgi:hypothetical protein